MDRKSYNRLVETQKKKVERLRNECMDEVCDRCKPYSAAEDEKAREALCDCCPVVTKLLIFQESVEAAGRLSSLRDVSGSCADLAREV